MARKLIAALCTRDYANLKLISNNLNGKYLQPLLINQFMTNIKAAILFAMQFFDL
jgi:hypothetical protein